ncbi:hypothetical protein AB0B85_28030 [Micromonospora sp. NPDC049044]|uniref:hypothetical protein n=1 Tax=unclassified Micromonospora TaxID=2617518 RepID=UPI0033FE6E20
MLIGRILAESLRVGCDIQVPGLRIVRIAREDVAGSRAPQQPAVWTLLDVEAPDEAADELAEALAGSLADGQGWYADFRVGTDHVIVYPGRVFHYTVGDHAGRDAAVQYGRLNGVPEHQLDWGE